MASFIEMLKYDDGTNFLKKHMFSSSLSSDGRKMTIKWNCWPQAVPYSYSYQGKKYTGYYSGGTSSNPGGIYRSQDNLETRHVREGIFEGVKTYSIKYRKNNGAWTTIKPSTYNEHIRTFSSTKNGDVFEIKVTYHLCTMGFPHRWYPFMWFGNYNFKGLVYYHQGSDGKYKKFTDAVPYFPGTYYPCVPDSWNPKTPYSYTWEEPTTKKCWSKLHGIANPKTSPWIESGHYERNSTSSKGDSWTSESGNTPQASRCSSYFIYQREFTDKFVTSGIIEKPPEAKPPKVPIVEPIPAHGEYGNVRVTYEHDGGLDGFIDLYATQKGNNSNAIKVASNIEVLDGDTTQIYVDFRKFSFVRSQEIRYYAIAKCYDEEYKTYRSTSSVKEYRYSNYATGHYFNEEPPAVVPSLVDSNDTTEISTITFRPVTDPDDDKVFYRTYIKSENEELNTNEKTFTGPGVNGKETYCMALDIFYNKLIPGTNTKNINVDIDMSLFKDRETISVWVESNDGYENSYYRTSPKVQIIKTKTPNASVEVEQVHGESGKIYVTYNHDSGVAGKVRIMAYQSTDNSGIDGNYLKDIAIDNNHKELEFSINEIGTTKELLIDFNNENFTRSRCISYFVIATDSNGKVSYDEAPQWFDCIGGHYFNEEPPPVTPTVEVIDEYAYLNWATSTDPDNDETTYELFISIENMPKEQEVFTGPGANGNLWYTYKIITKENKYSFNIKDYDAAKMTAWIRTRDNYSNSYYYSGNIVEFANPGDAPYKPLVTTVFAHEEQGDLYISYSHPTGRSGKVYLYAIGKYSNGDKILVNVFEKISNDNYIILSNNVNHPIKIDFRKLFDNRSCEIRYHAIAYTVGFEHLSSEIDGWTPNINMFDTWVTGHYFNDEPPAVIIEEDQENTDKHHNMFIRWNRVQDPDNDSIKYHIYLNALSNIYKKEDKFFIGNSTDRYLKYTHEYITENNELNISLRDFAEDENFELWIRSYDGYPNSYYNSSEIFTFQKLSYHAPVITASIDNVHGEKGKLTIKYTHPNYGQEDIDNTKTNGFIDVYAYVNNEYVKTIIEDIEFVHDETKEFEVNFSDITNKRSSYISYFIVATDILNGRSSSDTNPYFASAQERIGCEGNTHYFNEEPSMVFIKTGHPDKEEDRPYYMFDYVNVAWDEANDPDNDNIIYNIYIKTIDDNEPKYTKEFDFSYGKESKKYNRHYKIEYDNINNLYKTYLYLPESDDYIHKRDNNNLVFKIDYLNIEEGWQEPDAWKGKHGELWIETTDGYPNSYYRCSNIYEFSRQKHEPPNKVIIQCTTAHEEQGDLTITYTHPEDLEGTIYLYAYENGRYIETFNKTLVMKSGTTQSITVDFTNYFNRSTNISYYAIAKDNLEGLGLYSDNRTPEEIPIEEHATGHYFNDEPKAPNVSLVEGHTPFNTVKIKWDLVEDPDGDDVNYYIYLRCSTLGLNTKEEEFFGNKDLTEYGEEATDNYTSNGFISYYNVYKITPQMIANDNCNLGFDIDITPFGEDERLEIWIQTRDDYPNSYYYSGDILVFDKGHTANSIAQAYPRTNTIIYSKTPRILIELANDNLPQEVLIKWGNTTYSNITHSEYFSSMPKDYSRAVVFRPPVSYTTKHNSKVPYSVKINNTCTTSEEMFYTYIYKNFMEDFTDTKFIPLKSNHINTFKEAVNDVRDAYGLSTVPYNRKIVKDMILDNEDYNSVDNALKDINEKINNADPTDKLDDSRTYIIIEDGTLVGYNSETDTDFIEWQQLLDLLENM